MLEITYFGQFQVATQSFCDHLMVKYFPVKTTHSCQNSGTVAPVCFHLAIPYGIHLRRTSDSTWNGHRCRMITQTWALIFKASYDLLRFVASWASHRELDRMAPVLRDFAEWLVEVHVHLDVPPILLGTISGLRIGSRLIKPTMSSSTITKVGLCHCR